MRPIRWLVIICVVGLLFYGASPYFAFWRFTVAVQSRDAVAISSRVDFPAVRASLKKQLVARFARQTSGHQRWSNLGPTLIDAIIDAYLTPEGLAALLSNPEALQNLKAPREFQFTLGKPVKAWNVKYAFFTGPRSFVIDQDGITLRFHFTGTGWRLYYLDLGLSEQKRFSLLRDALAIERKHEDTGSCFSALLSLRRTDYSRWQRRLEKQSTNQPLERCP